MYARVTTVQADPGRMEDAVRFMREQVIPRAKTLPGFQGGYWLGDRTSGRSLAITLWDTEEEMRATEESASQLRDESVQQLGGTVVSVEHMEVLGQA